MGLSEMMAGDWIYLAQDGDQWRADGELFDQQSNQ